jgi:hypothetical protein
MSGICPGWTRDPDPAVIEYPKYSYDYAEAYSQQIELKGNSCPSGSSERFCSPTEANKVQLVKFIDAAGSHVGFLESKSEPITSQGHLDKEGTGNLQPWQPFGQKETYRFCVETKDKYLVYREEADSLTETKKENWNPKLNCDPATNTCLGGFNPVMKLDELPLRYKFAVRVLP